MLAILTLLLGLLHPNAAPQPAPAPASTALKELRGRAAERPLVIAHRGESGEYPENTLPAFRAAVEAKADVIELDFYESRDGVLFCFHDETLDRTTDGEAVHGRNTRCDRLAWADLARLDAGAWKGARFRGTPIPTLEQALDAVGRRAVVMIEHKGGSAERLVDLLRRKDLVDAVLVQSFDWTFVEQVARLEPRVALGALGSKALDEDGLRRLRGLEVDFVHWKATDLTLDAVQAVRKNGWMLCTYTLNEPIGMAGAFALGIDGVTTDHPRRLHAVLDHLARSSR